MASDDFIGDRFQELTKYSRTRISGGARPGRSPSPFKEYPGAETISLAAKDLPKGLLWQALQGRRSRRTFTGEAIAKNTLAHLVFAAQGATAAAGGIVLRTAPSAGALYPVETYLVINRVKGVDPGVYHYNARRAELEAIKRGSYGKELSEAALGQGMAGRAALVFVWTAIADRSKWKYAQRAYRYIYIDAGHICENVYLAAQALGLGCCAMGAFFDEEVNQVLEVDGETETAIYLAAVGPVREGKD